MADLDQPGDDNIMDFANLTFIEDVTTPELQAKFFQDRFDDMNKFLIVESPIPLCINGHEKTMMIEKANDIVRFWTDIKNGTFDA